MSNPYRNNRKSASWWFTPRGMVRDPEANSLLFWFSAAYINGMVLYAAYKLNEENVKIGWEALKRDLLSNDDRPVTATTNKRWSTRQTKIMDNAFHVWLRDQRVYNYDDLHTTTQNTMMIKWNDYISKDVDNLHYYIMRTLDFQEWADRHGHRSNYIQDSNDEVVEAYMSHNTNFVNS